MDGGRTLFMSGPRGRYLAFGRSDVRADVYVGISPIGFFVFPSKVWETFPERTMFFPIVCLAGKRGFAHSNRHDYLNYLEAWKLIRSPRLVR